MLIPSRKKQTLRARISNAAGAVVAGLFIALIIVLAVAYEWSMWNECFDDGHSFLYCSRVLNK